MKKIGIIFFVIIISAAMVLLPMAPAANAQSPTDTPTPTDTVAPGGSATPTVTATPELVYEWLPYPGSWTGNTTSPAFNFDSFCNGSVEAIAYHEHGDSGGYSWIHNGHWQNEAQDYGVVSQYRVFGHIGSNDPGWIAERVSELQPFDWVGPMPSGVWGDIGWYGSFNTQFQMAECCGSTGNRVDHIQVLCHHVPEPEPVPDGDLVGFWHLDEKTNRTRQDATQNDLDLSEKAFSDIGTTIGIHGLGTFWDIGAVGEYLYHDDTELLSTGDINFSWSAWVYPKLYTDIDNIYVAKGDEYILGYDGYMQDFYFSVNNQAVYSDIELTSETWYHLVGRFDNTNNQVCLTVNLNTVCEAALNPGIDATDDLRIGENHNISSASFRLDEVGFWKRVISEDDIAFLYNNSFGCSYPFDHCTPATDIVFDGGFENWFWHGSEGWHPIYYGHNDDIGTSNKQWWNRFNLSEMPIPWRWIWGFQDGYALCGSGYQIVGPPNSIGTRTTDYEFGRGMPVTQLFNWSGGDLYWKLSARSRFQNLPPNMLEEHANVYIYDTNSNNTYMLLDNVAIGEVWEQHTGTITSFPAGQYVMVLSMDMGEYWQDPEGMQRAIYYDDVSIGNQPLSQSCSDNILIGTPTPNPMTPTPPEEEPTIGPGGLTPTPGPSQTPAVDYLFLSNCGFQAGGAGWTFRRGYVALEGGPVDPQWAAATDVQSSIYRYIYLGQSTTLYLTTFIKGGAKFQAVNTSSGAVYTLYSGTSPTWKQVHGTYTVPAGTYRIELNSFTYGVVAGFDGIVLSRYGYGDTDPFAGECINTPTPGPTAFMTPTITPDWSPTPTRTGTVLPGGTPTPSKTPYGEPWITSTPWGTTTPGTAIPTWDGTPGTATIVPGTGTVVPGTGTVVPGTPMPGGTGTPRPGGDQPPTDWGDGDGPVSCDRPTNPWSIAWWIDYETCRIVAYASFGPAQLATAQYLPQVFTTYEPIRSVNNFVYSVHAASTEIASYNWADTGDYVNTDIGESLDPESPLQTWGSNPWIPGNGIQFGNNNNGRIFEFYKYCSNRLAENRLAGYLSEGYCFVLGVFRELGYFRWIQWIINILAIIGIVRSFQLTLGMKPTEFGLDLDNKDDKSKDD